MTRKELPPPRVFKLNHPRLIRIRNNLRKVIQLAVQEEWHKLSNELNSLLEDVSNVKDLPFQKRRLFYRLNEKANWLEQSYIDSIISKKHGNVGGVDTDVSGDRVRVFIGKTYEDYHKDLGGAKYVIKKHFFSISEYKRNNYWLIQNYEKYAPLWNKNPEKFISFEEFHFITFK